MFGLVIFAYDIHLKISMNGDFVMMMEIKGVIASKRNMENRNLLLETQYDVK